MIRAVVPGLDRKRVLLASTSPRRRQILDLVGLQAEITASGFDEDRLDGQMFPDRDQFVQASAYLKASWASAQHPDADLIVAADTIVVLDDSILGKPQSSTPRESL